MKKEFRIIGLSLLVYFVANWLNPLPQLFRSEFVNALFIQRTFFHGVAFLFFTWYMLKKYSIGKGSYPNVIVPIVIGNCLGFLTCLFYGFSVAMLHVPLLIAGLIGIWGGVIYHSSNGKLIWITSVIGISVCCALIPWWIDFVILLCHHG